MDNSRPKYKKNLDRFFGEYKIFFRGGGNIPPYGCLEYTLLTYINIYASFGFHIFPKMFDVAFCQISNGFLFKFVNFADFRFDYISCFLLY